MVNIPTTGLLTNEGAGSAAGSAAGGAASSGFSFNTGLGYIGTAYNLQQGISDGDAAAI
ncbi:MAG: hypothetical protein GY941_16565, partial [Planctomycetes bacterium]|nr:hypothetical protein [Planctomycetota bacterium]